MKAWQRTRREECAEEDRENLFGAWWEDIDTSLERAVVREIDQRTASVVVEKYEWLRAMPAVNWHCYGLFFDNEALGGVVVYGPEYAENLGVWDRYGYTGRLILLSRGVTLHWAHPHASSFLIRRSMAMLPPRFEVVTAITDPKAGEVGTVYQAAGFTFVGSMNSFGHGGKRAGRWVVGERRLSERNLNGKLGLGFTDEQVRTAYPTVVIEGGRAVEKGRYFAFRGPRDAKRRNRKAIKHFIKPYPKRAEGVEETIPAFQPGGGGAMPSLRFEERAA